MQRKANDKVMDALFEKVAQVANSALFTKNTCAKRGYYERKFCGNQVYTIIKCNMKRLAVLISLFILVSFDIKAQPTLKIYGGKNHDQFLGCINCDTRDLNSVWSTFSDYGSIHSDKSIWSEKGIYGNKLSDYSPFNENAKCPPLIVDENGKSHGYLTINKKNSNRSKDSVADIICNERDEIVKGIPEFYNRILRRVY
jgi:hypothetical protein